MTKKINIGGSSFIVNDEFPLDLLERNMGDSSGVYSEGTHVLVQLNIPGNLKFWSRKFYIDDNKIRLSFLPEVSRLSNEEEEKLLEWFTDISLTGDITLGTSKVLKACVCLSISLENGSITELEFSR